MSSNHPHIDLNRSNYEDYFLLYVDGELTPEECDAVEAFAAAHPDLQEELDALLTTRLEAEPVVFPDKSSLMADSMKSSAIDESLLLYLDNELSGEEKAGMEWELEKNPDLQAQYQLLLKAKLDPTEKIAYPHKAELYRHEERAVRPMFWLRAAAVVILAGWGAFWYLDNYTGTPGGETVALQPPPVVKSPAATPAQSATPAPRVNNPVADATPAANDRPAETHTAKEEQPAVAVQTARTSNRRADYREIAKAPVVIPTEVATTVPAQTERPRVETINNTPQQNINAPAVTLPNTVAYNKVEVPTGEDARGSVAREDNDKKGSMRGFLRKTTRFIERRTGIDPTNEGDELMIGALTINLK